LCGVNGKDLLNTPIQVLLNPKAWVYGSPNI
jgi:hypothetical protein